VPRTLGGLAVLPGSQHSATVRNRPLTRLERGWATTDYEAGDVLVFHCLTTHAALPNREQRMRFSAEFRWQLADKPAPRRMVIVRTAVSSVPCCSGERSCGGLCRKASPGPKGAVPDEGPLLPVPPSHFVSLTYESRPNGLLGSR
jgi:Phytanoyl-CoA dioxygenase (PhyH)